MKPLLASVGAERFLVTEHAIVRYAQRASPWPDDPDRARRQLGSLIRTCGELVRDAPGWMHARPDDAGETAAQYLMLGGDVALPIVARGAGMVAVTCLARGGVSAKSRERRREWRAQRSHARREKRKHRAWLGESGPRWR